MSDKAMVRLLSPHGNARGTQVFNSDGNAIPGVRSVAADISLDGPTTIKVELLLADVEVQGVPRFYAVHPNTGKLEQLDRLVFADGTVFPNGE